MTECAIAWAQKQLEPFHKILVERLGENYWHTQEYNEIVLKVAGGTVARFLIFDLQQKPRELVL